MAAPTFRDHMLAMFEPLTAACGRADLLQRLRTADLDLPEDERKAEFERLKATRIIGDGPLMLNGGAVFVRFKSQDRTYIALSMEHLTEEENASLVDKFLEHGLCRADLDPTFFLFCTYSLKGYLRASKSYSSSYIDNILDVVDKAYTGHTFFDVIDLYENIQVFCFEDDCALLDKSDWYIAAKIAYWQPAFGTPLLQKEVSDKLDQLSALSNINPENLYFAFTSVHWKHVFLEVYKCIEAIYFLPWMVKLRGAGISSGNALEMARVCRESLSWREKEKESIRALFEMAPASLILDAGLSTILAFKDYNASWGHGAVAERVYKIRNQNVHQEDYEDATPLELSARCWPTLVIYMADVVAYFYSQYATDIAFEFESASLEAYA